MKIFTVTQTDWIDGRIDTVLPFQFAYRSLEQAQASIREAAQEAHIGLYKGEEEVPEMEGPAQYRTVSGVLYKFASNDFASDWTDWEITEVILED